MPFTRVEDMESPANSILIYGIPRVGKTVLGCTISEYAGGDDVLLITPEINGAESLRAGWTEADGERVPLDQVRVEYIFQPGVTQDPFAHMINIIREVAGGPIGEEDDAINHLVIDGLTSIGTAAMMYRMGDDASQHRDMGQDGWDWLLMQFYRVSMELRALLDTGRSVVWIAHTEVPYIEKKIVMRTGGPMAYGKAKTFVPGDVTFIMRMSSNAMRTGKFSSQLQIAASEDYIAGSRKEGGSFGMETLILDPPRLSDIMAQVAEANAPAAPEKPAPKTKSTKPKPSGKSSRGGKGKSK